VAEEREPNGGWGWGLKKTKSGPKEGVITQVGRKFNAGWSKGKGQGTWPGPLDTPPSEKEKGKLTGFNKKKKSNNEKPVGLREG